MATARFLSTDVFSSPVARTESPLSSPFIFFPTRGRVDACLFGRGIWRGRSSERFRGRVAYLGVLVAIWLLGTALTPNMVMAEPATDELEASEIHVDFDQSVAPLLSKYCLECHRGPQGEGGLDLSRREAAFQGGESGSAVVPNDLESSLLWQYIDSSIMPPEDRPAPTEEEKKVLRDWIRSGASWGEDPIDPFRVSSEIRAGRDWWSLQPLQPLQPPGLRRHVRTPEEAQTAWKESELSRDAAAGASHRGNPVDHFIRRRLHENELDLSPPADPRTLIRRVYFDLIGLPPTPEEVAEFLRDPSEIRYAEVVDRLLASPRHGERWGRHWLDVVRFGESDGFERNLARDHAWPYRNWVIDAFNADMPYDQFVRWQIAGDVFEPDRPEAVAATGFLVAGIHNTVVANTETARAFARHDELEDLAATLGQAFLGLTIHCARCHDHKFDPISQEEYYRFVATLDGIEPGERILLSEREQREREQRLDGLRQRADRLREERRGLEVAARQRWWKELSMREDSETGPSGIPVVPRAHYSFSTRESQGRETDDAVWELGGRLHGGARIDAGQLVLNGTDAYFESDPLTADISEKTLEVWATLQNLQQRGGGLMTVETSDGTRFDSLVFGEQEEGHWMSGSEFFRRTQSVGGPRETRGPDDTIHLAVTYRADGEIALFRDGEPYGRPYRPMGPDSKTQTYSAGDARVLFGKRHTGGARSYFAGGLRDARLYDRALTPVEIRASYQAGPMAAVMSAEVLRQVMTDAERTRAAEIRRELDKTTREIDRFPDAPKGYVAASRQPSVMHVLHRGDVRAKGEPVAPGGLRAVGGDHDFPLDQDADDAARRAALAEWLTSPENPLLARVIVNRLWHHHFGRGIVDTPSDFGFNGSQPSHPELLDHLAAELIRGGYRLKPLHRLIVLSDTYRQSSLRRPEGVRRDADNRWLWRMTPRRLEAEAIRDSMLYLAGELNLEMGGPGYRDVRPEFLSGTTYFEPLDVLGVAQQRRTVYRFSPRGERSALLDTFDCPDPSVTTPRRQITTTPLQAMALWNDEFVLQLADRLTERVQADMSRETMVAGDESVPATTDADVFIRRLIQYLFQREPTERELSAAQELVNEHGGMWLARVLLNSNEFVVVE